MGRGPIRVAIIEGDGCGGCRLEAVAACSGRHGALRRGIRLVDAPAHADVLLICGPLNELLAEQVQRLEQTLGMSWVRLQLGDCAASSAAVPGCPPEPEAILAAIASAGAHPDVEGSPC